MVGAACIAPLASGGLVHVIIDTPRGSCNKYKLDEASGLFKLSRILPDGLHFPCDFGFIPATAGEDGDALDVALVSEFPSFAGCLMTARLLGVIRALQTEKGKTIRNDRLVAVPVTPANRPKQRDLRDVPRAWLDALEHFFIAYNQAQGRALRVQSRGGARAAQQALHSGIVMRGAIPR